MAAGVSTLLALSPRDAWAHGLGGGGVLLPLTGFDHMVALLAVGAWSATSGGRAVMLVPAAFVVAMTFGWSCRFAEAEPPWVEGSLAASVLVLGVALALRLRLPTRLTSSLALLATLMVGFTHGYGHAAELRASTSPSVYLAGFLLTTPALLGAGAAMALLLLERRDGEALLRGAGTLLGAVGLWLMIG